MSYFLDFVPIWVLFVVTVAITWLAIEVGFLAGRHRVRRGPADAGDSMAGIHGSILALLAFILAITFSMAATRYDTRKQLVLAEANAIGTCFLRAEMLPPPLDADVQSLLREYVDVRLEGVRTGELELVVARSEELHAVLWSKAVQLSREADQSHVFSLFVQSLNEVIDLHQERVVWGIDDRIPPGVWVVLYLVSVLAMLAVGYDKALSSSGRSIATVVLAMAFSLVIVLIVDLDRTQSGALTISQQALIDVSESIAE